MKMKGLRKAVSALLAISMLGTSVYAATSGPSNGFTESESYMGIGKIVMDMTVSEDELSGIKAEAKKELEALGANSAYNLSLVDLAKSENAIYSIVDNAASEIGAEFVNLPYNNTYSVDNAEILYEGVSDDGKTLSDTSVVSLASSVITADGLGRAIVKAGEKKLLIKTKKADIALVLVSGQSNAQGAESDASLTPSALGEYKGRYFITNSMNQGVALSDITWAEAKYEAEHGGAPSSDVAIGSWATTSRSAGVANQLAARLSDEWNMAVWVVNTGFGGHPMEGFDPTKGSHGDYTNTVNIVNKVKEVIASDKHYVLKTEKTGLFWIQGCSDGIGTDSENTMAEYVTMFTNMFSGWKTDIGINYAGIWLVRAGTYNDNGDKDFYMSGPRLAQHYMANSNSGVYKDIYLVFNTDVWRTDAGVENHFKARHADEAAFKAYYGYDLPKLRSEIKPDIHYRQKGYNELGDIAGEVIDTILKGEAVTPTTASLFGYDGNEIASIGITLEASKECILVPIVTSGTYNASFNLKVVSANESVAKFDNNTFTLKGIGVGETTIGIYLGETLLKSYPVVVEGAAVNVCYIGEEENDRKYYTTIHKAVSEAASGDTIYVTDNITWDGVTTYHNKNITITSVGTKKTITMPATSNLKITGTSGNVTFKNITLDFNFNGKMLAIDDGATVNLVGADVLNGKGGVGGTVILGGGTNGNLVMDENSVISGRATENAAVGSVVHLHSNNGISTFTMNGGKIINYDSSTTRYAVATWVDANCKIVIGGNATIVNGTSSEATPSTGKADAIKVKSADRITLKGNFTGDIKIAYGSIGDIFGIAEEGATITGNIENYSVSAKAAIDGNNLVWEEEEFVVDEKYVCYIGDSAETGTLYESLSDAVKATNNTSVKTIHLLKDTTWEGHTYEGGYGIHHKYFILEGHGFKVTLGQLIHVSLNSDFTLNDVTIDVNKDYCLLVGNNAKLTLGNKTVVTGRTTDGYAVGIENRNGDGGTFTMLPGSKITGNKANILGAVYVGCKSTVKIEGEITGNTSGAGAIRINNSNAKLILGKNANVTGNTSKNIVPTSGTQITIASDFTGTAGISYGGAGDAFAKFESGATFTGIKNDADDTLEIKTRNGNAIWKVFGEEEGKCYVDDDTENLLTLHEAIGEAKSGSTIYVTDNITWDGVTTYYNKNITITSVGAKKTITMPATSNLRITGASGNVTFENITLDFNFNGKMMAIDDGATVNLVGADVINGKGGVGGTIQLGAGTNGHLVMDENSLITGRATENAAVGAVVHLHGSKPTSTFTMNGGKIINYDSSSTRYAVAVWSDNANSKIIISKNATIVNGESSEATPSTGNVDAIRVKNADQLVLKGNFTGSIKVNCGAFGNVFGAAEEGATITGSLTSYTNGAVATVSEGKLIWNVDGDCYVGDNAFDKITLKDAIEKAPSGSVIHLVRDVTLTETLMLNRIGVSLTIDGTNGDDMYKVEFPVTAEDDLATANKRIFHIRNGYLTLNNVILSGGIHKDYGGSVIVEEASCSLTLTGKTEIRGAKATNGGAVWVRKGALTIKDDVLITENTASMKGGAIYSSDIGSKVNLEGGKITGNFGPGGGGIYAGKDTNIYFKNDAYVYGNVANKETNAESNIIVENADIIVLNDSFTGKAGISFGKLKETFGKISGGSGEYNLISDTNSGCYGYAEDGKLIWIPGQLKLSVEQDAGIAGEKATIRFITNFDMADNMNALSYGTYVIPKALFEDYEKDVYGSTENSLKAYFRSAKAGDTGYKAPKTGESFGVDYVEIPENAFDMEFIAISFINLNGTYIYKNHGTVSVNGFGDNLKTLD